MTAIQVIVDHEPVRTPILAGIFRLNCQQV
jgi:hypothetical protein